MLNDVFSNHVLLASACAWALAQVTKTIVALFQGKSIQAKFLFASGGMPSAHSALVSALATAVAMVEGARSIAFAISTALALIVMYDATGVRHAVSRQSVVINRIVEEIRLGRPMTQLKSDLRELVGHTPYQVFAGAGLGIGTALLWVTVFGR
jgi:acid phosphatase family membrane protein YuiD